MHRCKKTLSRGGYRSFCYRGYPSCIGKIRELKYKKGFDYTDEGRLIGHILVGIEMVEEKIRQVKDFPPKLAILIKHLIVSHKGTHEWGSPKVPQDLEALILYNLDDLSAKVNIFRKAMGQIRARKETSATLIRP